MSEKRKKERRRRRKEEIRKVEKDWRVKKKGGMRIDKGWGGRTGRRQEQGQRFG